MRPSDELRLAIALIALRHKSAKQSCASYVLDLQHSFPLRNAESASPAANAEQSEPWRTRVVELEKELRDLRTKCDSQSIELATCRITAGEASGDRESTPSCPAPTPVPNKKKSKRKASSSSAPVEPKANDKHPQDTPRDTLAKPVIPELFAPNSMLSAFQILDTLVEARRHKLTIVSTKTCALAANRALDCLSMTLNSLLPPATPTSASSGVMQTLSTLLHRLVLVALPLLSPPRRNENPASHAREDALVGRLATTVLIPLISSFHPLSLAHLSAVFSTDITARSPSGRSQKAYYDIRPDALDMLRTALNALHELSLSSSGKPFLIASIQSAFEALTLSATRELAELYPPLRSGEDEQGSCLTARISSDVGETARASSPFPHAHLQPPQLSRQTQGPAPGEKQKLTHAQTPRSHAAGADRIAKLARKDALWYLCSVLHLAIPHATPGTSALLREGVCTVLAGVLRRAGRAAGIGIHMQRRAPCRDGDDPDFADEIEDGHEAQGSGCGAVRSVRARTGLGTVGAVEREMILAVAEKLWLAQG